MCYGLKAKKGSLKLRVLRVSSTLRSLFCLDCFLFVHLLLLSIYGKEKWSKIGYLVLVNILDEENGNLYMFHFYSVFSRTLIEDDG